MFRGGGHLIDPTIVLCTCADIAGQGRQGLGRALALFERGALLLHAAKSLGGRRGLLFGRGRNDFGPSLGLARRSLGFHGAERDRAAGLRKVTDLFAQFAQGENYSLALFRLRGGADGCVLDHRGDGLHLLLNLLRKILHIARTPLGGLRQRPHLVGHDGKTTPVISSSRSLDGSIERQQIGLVRNMADGPGYVTDARGLCTKLIHDGDRVGLSLSIAPDVARPSPNLTGSLGEQAFQSIASPLRRFRSLPGLQQGGGSCVGDGESLLCGAGSFLRASGDLLHRTP